MHYTWIVVKLVKERCFLRNSLAQNSNGISTHASSYTPPGYNRYAFVEEVSVPLIGHMKGRVLLAFNDTSSRGCH